MTLPSLDSLIDQGLWERVRESLREQGVDPDEAEARAAANLSHYRGRPRPPMTDAERAEVVAWIMDDSLDAKATVIR